MDPQGIQIFASKASSSRATSTDLLSHPRAPCTSPSTSSPPFTLLLSYKLMKFFLSLPNGDSLLAPSYPLSSHLQFLPQLLPFLVKPSAVSTSALTQCLPLMKLWALTQASSYLTKLSTCLNSTHHSSPSPLHWLKSLPCIFFG